MLLRMTSLLGAFAKIAQYDVALFLWFCVLATKACGFHVAVRFLYTVPAMAAVNLQCLRAAALCTLSDMCNSVHQRAYVRHNF